MVTTIKSIVATFGYIAEVSEVQSRQSAKQFNTLYEVSIPIALSDRELLAVHSAIRPLKVNFSLEVPNV